MVSPEPVATECCRCRQDTGSAHAATLTEIWHRVALQFNAETAASLEGCWGSRVVDSRRAACECDKAFSRDSNGGAPNGRA
jgi:hypothetical protein